MKKKLLFFLLSFFIIVVVALFFISHLCKSDASITNKAPSLVIFSPHPEEITEYIVREFRQRTGIHVLVVSKGTGELIEKIKSKKGEYEADLLWGGGIESLETINSYFEEFISTEESMIQDDIKSTHHLWNPFSVLPAVIIYNASLIPPEHIPDSWQDLLDPWFKNRLIIADPVKSGSSFTILATLLKTMNKENNDVFGGWYFIKRLITNLGDQGVVPSSSLVYSSVAAGDFYAGITFEHNVLALQKTGANVSYCYPSEGTSALPDGIALLKSAQNRKEAELFINFVLSKNVQEILPAKWQRRSVRKDVPNQKKTSQENFIYYPIPLAAQSRESILNQWAELYDQ